MSHLFYGEVVSLKSLDLPSEVLPKITKVIFSEYVSLWKVSK